MSDTNETKPEITLGDIQNAVTEMKSTVKADVETVKAEIGSVKSDIETIKADKSAVNAVNEIKSRIDNLETVINRPNFQGGNQMEKSELKAINELLRNPSQVKAIPIPQDVVENVDRTVVDSYVRTIVGKQTTGRDSVTIRVPKAQSATMRTASSPSAAAYESESVECEVEKMYIYATVDNDDVADVNFDLLGDLNKQALKAFRLKEQFNFAAGRGHATYFEWKGISDVTQSTDVDGTRAFGTIQKIDAATPGTLVLGDLENTVLALDATEYLPNARWQINPADLSKVRTILDEGDNPVWRTATMGFPNTLMDYPVNLNASVPEGELYFGDFEAGFSIVDRQGPTIESAEKIADQTKYFISKRAGGAVTDTNAIKVLVIGTST